MSRAIAIRTLDGSYSAQAFDLICEVFVPDSVLHRALEITPEEYRSRLAVGWDTILAEGLSLVAVDPEGDVVQGCLLGARFSPTPVDPDTVPRKLLPLARLLEDLERQYDARRVGAARRALLVDIAVVAPARRGEGVYTRLREAAHALGVAKGYDHVIGELSSATTQRHLVDRLGHVVRAEIAFETYVFEGRYPFKGITDPPTVQLVEGHLSPP